MSTETQNTSSLLETIDLWETIVVEERTTVEALVLEVQSESIGMKPQELSPGQNMTVGRTSESQLKVSCDKKVSREHFSIECCDDHAVVRDLNSTNGTFVNGMRINEMKVYDGDQITAGTTIFTVRLLTN
jgi:pSer/pThr/pTyr-binding forkhead associated (FHA) protein